MTIVTVVTVVTVLTVVTIVTVVDSSRQKKIIKKNFTKKQLHQKNSFIKKLFSTRTFSFFYQKTFFFTKKSCSPTIFCLLKKMYSSKTFLAKKKKNPLEKRSLRKKFSKKNCFHQKTFAQKNLFHKTFFLRQKKTCFH